MIVVRNEAPDHEIYKQVFIAREYDFDFKHEIRTILDLGAHIGLAAIFFAKKYPGAEIVCVEPSRDNFNILLEQELLWQAKRFCAAIGPTYGKVRVVEPTGEGSWARRTVPDDSGDVEQWHVPYIMSDSEWDRISLLKVDIEGAEAQLFGSDTVWLHKVDAVMIELHEYIVPGVCDLVAGELMAHGLKFRGMRGENAVFTRDA